MSIGKRNYLRIYTAAEASLDGTITSLIGGKIIFGSVTGTTAAVWDIVATWHSGENTVPPSNWLRVAYDNTASCYNSCGLQRKVAAFVLDVLAIEDFVLLPSMHQNFESCRHAMAIFGRHEPKLTYTHRMFDSLINHDHTIKLTTTSRL